MADGIATTSYLYSPGRIGILGLLQKSSKTGDKNAVYRPLINWANALTLSRFALAPVMLWLTLQLEPGAWGISIAAFLLLGLTLLTDLFDGMVARAHKVVTNFGKIMDPVADSTFFLTVLFALSASPRFRDAFPVWMPVAVLYREVAMQVLRRYAALRGIVLAAKWSGKAKMVVQSVLLLLFFAGLALNDWLVANGKTTASEATVDHALWWVGLIIVVVNVASLAEYAREAPEFLREPPESAPGTSI